MCEDVRGKRLAVIGGNIIMEEVCRFAKRNDLTVVSFAASKASVVHKYSDEQCYVDCSDPLTMISLLKEKKIDAIVAISGEKMQRRIVDWIFQSGYRFYATKEQWAVLMDKQHFKQYAVQFGIPAIPEYTLVTDHHEVQTRFPFSVVIKPTDNSGSSGVSICRENSDLTAAYADALRYAANGLVVCEKYLQGPYFQFEIWNQNGKSFFPYTKERIYYPPIGQHPPQPFLDIYPSADSELISGSLYHKVERMFQSLGIRNGSCMFQGIIDHDTPYIMDTAFRISGGLDYKVIREEKGIDLVGAHIQYALTGQFGDDFSMLDRPYEYIYANLCLGLKDGIISRIDGLDAVRRSCGVFAVHQNYHVGDIIHAGTFSQIGMHVFIKAKTRSLLMRYVEEVLKKVRIENDKEESMLLPFPSLSNLREDKTLISGIS
jgi:hypothetical protein